MKRQPRGSEENNTEREREKKKSAKSLSPPIYLMENCDTSFYRCSATLPRRPSTPAPTIFSHTLIRHNSERKKHTYYHFAFMCVPCACLKGRRLCQISLANTGEAGRLVSDASALTLTPRDDATSISLAGFLLIASTDCEVKGKYLPSSSISIYVPL